MLKYAWLLCGVLLSGWPLVPAADELKERQLISDRAMTLFHSRQFAVLDEDAAKYRESGARTSSGLWKLTMFYDGLSEVPNRDVTDEVYWTALENEALKWVAAHPNSPAGHLVYAEFLMSRAWMYRGNGWGYQVRSEDWKPFHESMAKARQYLNKHKAVASRDPHWYDMMIRVATAQGWETQDFNALVAEATSRYPYFYQLYFSAMNYLTPKWHGSREEVEKFAQKAVKITRGEEGEAMYSRIYWAASQSNFRERLFTDSSVVWAKMSKSMDEVLKRYPDQWNINNFAYFSCLAGDADKTSSLMGRITGRPILQAWKSMDYYERCKLWSSARRKHKDDHVRVGPSTPL